jgi:esterase/lipase superfamily enzyme
MMKLVDFLRPKNLGQPCGQKLHLLAHSMGNYVLRNALWELKKMYPGQHLPTIFENIFLMAADEDNDAFEMEQKFRDLPSLARQVNVYFNKYDKALWCSDLTKGNPDRLGNTGPRKPLDVPAKVVLIDVSALDPFTDFIGQGYYDSWKGVIDDVTAVFEGLEPDKIPGRHYVPSANKYRLG